MERYHVSTFYVGNHGTFDAIARIVLREMKGKYPSIQYWVVLAYLPEGKAKEDTLFDPTIYPEGIEGAPKRFAISYRNRWMLQNADYVVVYKMRSWGNTAQVERRAKNASKAVINIADT